jgi:hypothetical protein
MRIDVVVCRDGFDLLLFAREERLVLFQCREDYTYGNAIQCCICSKFRENSYINCCVWFFCRCICTWLYDVELWLAGCEFGFRLSHIFVFSYWEFLRRWLDSLLENLITFWSAVKYVRQVDWSLLFSYLVHWSLFWGERKTDCLLFNITLYDKMFDVGYEVGALAVRNATLKLELRCWFSFHLILPLVF